MLSFLQEALLIGENILQRVLLIFLLVERLQELPQQDLMPVNLT
jgi:hypothetical protein